MKVELKGRVIPRNEKGDPTFRSLTWGRLTQPANDERPSVLEVFTEPEVVELVNRALYQMEYQRESHRKRGKVKREQERLLKEELKRQGKDVKAGRIEGELKGE